ncbi:MAG: GTP-binding protein, partial [Pararhizobium sp.]
MTVSAIAQAALAEAATGTVTAFPAIEPARLPRDTRPLRLITCGSVDDGKSTLIGRLLWDTKAVKEDQAATLRRDSGK